VTIGASGACSISGDTVTMTTGTGICQVTFDQSGDATYAAAPQVMYSTTAQKAIPTVSLTGGTFPFDGASHGATGFAYGVGGVGDILSPAVTFSYNGTGSTTYGPTSMPPSATGTYNATAFFAGNTNYTAASNSAALTITADITPPETTLTSVPLSASLSSTANFVFMAYEAGSAFAISLDGGAFTAYVRPNS